MDSFDYQRSTLPSRLPASRSVELPATRFTSVPHEVPPPSPLSVRAVLRAARRYWWLILALWTVGVSGLGALIYLKVRPQYHATSLLKVDPTMLDLYGSSSSGGVQYMQTYVDLIKSPAVFSATVNDPEVSQIPRIKHATDAIQELTKSIQVGIRPGTQLIEVSMISQSADEAALIVNEVVGKFLEANRGWSGQSVKSQIKKLSDHLDELKAKSQLIENEIKTLTARGNVGPKVVRRKADAADGKADKDDQAEVINWNVEHYQQVVGRLLQIETELAVAESRRIGAERVVEEANRLATQGAPKGQPSRQVEPLVEADPEVREVLKRYTQLKGKYEALERKIGLRSDPGKDSLMSLLNQTQAEYQQARLRAKFRLEQQMTVGNGIVASPNIELQHIQAEIQQLISRRDVLKSQVANLKVETNKQMTEEVDIRFLEDRRHAIDGNINMITNRLAALTMEQSSEDKIYQIDPAQREKAPIADKRKMYLAAMPFGVLGVVLALAVLLEVRSGRVADPDFLSARVPHEVFAIAPLPTARAAIGSSVDRNEQRLARFVQSLDHLRVALCEGGSNGEGRCVMITSATGGEGKTTLSAHLAARCANAGTATLLIDADLRRGSLGRLLDVPPGPGLGDLLAGHVELDGGLISTQAGGFHFLSVGTPGIDPTRVLRSTRLAELIGQFRQMYDLIIIDTPPVLPVADALILGRWADGAVVAARYDASRLPLLERANRQIASAGIPVLGVVVNGVRGQDQAYGSYNYAYPGTRDTLDGSAVTS